MQAIPLDYIRYFSIINFILVCKALQLVLLYQKRTVLKNKIYYYYLSRVFIFYIQSELFLLHIDFRWMLHVDFELRHSTCGVG